MHDKSSCLGIFRSSATALASPARACRWTRSVQHVDSAPTGTQAYRSAGTAFPGVDRRSRSGATCGPRFLSRLSGAGRSSAAVVHCRQDSVGGPNRATRRDHQGSWSPRTHRRAGGS